MEEITPPVVVVDTEGWISVFGSVAQAEADLEAPDVQAGEYVGFDAEGRRLVFRVVEVQAPDRWWRRIRFQAPISVGLAASQPRPDLLMAMLAESLGADPVRADLPTLIRRAGATRGARAPTAAEDIRRILPT